MLLDLITLILLLSMGEVEEWLDLTQTAMDVIGFLLGLHVFVFVFVFRVCCFWFEFSSPTVAVQGTQANFNFDYIAEFGNVANVKVINCVFTQFIKRPLERYANDAEKEAH